MWLSIVNGEDVDKISSDNQNKKCSNGVATPTTHYENDDTQRRMKRPEKHAEIRDERR